MYCLQRLNFQGNVCILVVEGLIPPLFEDLAAVISDSVAPQISLARKVDFVTGRYLCGLLQSPGQTERSTKYH